MPDVAGPAKALRESLDLAPGERIAVVACRLVATKRVGVAIEAVRASSSALRLVVVGDGPERARLAVAAAGAAVTFTGALPRRDALGWIAAADVLVHPSAVESAPTVVREARALGVPVVACAAGDLEAWAEADAGIRIAPPDARAIAGAIASACR